MGAILNISYGTPLVAASVAADITDNASDYEGLRLYLSELFDGVSSVQGSAITVSVTDVTSGTVAGNSTVVATITEANIVPGTDTVVIGTVTLTWEAAPANENEILVGADDDECAINLAAAINDHSILGAVLVAEAVDNTCIIVYPSASSAAALLSITETGTGVALTANDFASSATLAQVLGPVSVRKGV